MLINTNHYFHNNKQLPPQHILVEEIIIGQLLLNTKFKQYIIDRINPNVFTIQKHRILYLSIIHINNKNKNINTIELINQLWTKQLLNSIGGIKNIIYIIQKSQTIFTNYHQDSYIKLFITILHYYYIKRLFIQYSYSILQFNYIHNINIQQIYQKSIKYLNTIYKTHYRHNSSNLYHNISNFLNKLDKSSTKNCTTFSGFKELDKITNGFKAGELIIIAGRPSMGKTSLAINIAYNLISHFNIPVHIFSLEMSKNEILDKLIALSSNIAIHYIKNKIINKKHWLHIKNTCSFLINSPLYIDDIGNTSIDYIKSQCKYNIIEQTNIIIDYLQLIKLTQHTIENRSEEISQITRELKLLAKDIKSPIIVLSQLNRNIENRVNKRPLLSDLRESGCICYSNTPNIQLQQLNRSITILYCLYKSYHLNQNRFFKLHNIKNQYIYLLKNYNQTSLYITHNHKVLINYNWTKEDKIKLQNFHITKLKNKFNQLLILELNIFQKIKLLNQTPVYDITSYEYCNFLVNEHIIHNSIEQDADLILMLYKNNNDFENQILDIIIAKHRNGPIGSFQLLFHADKCKFDNINNTPSL